MRRLAYIWLILLSMTGTVTASIGATGITPYLLFSAVAIPSVMVHLVFLRKKIVSHGTMGIIGYLVLASTIHVFCTSWISVAYSVFFLLAFVCLLNIWRDDDTAGLRGTLKVIILLYLGNVLLAMCLTGAGMPVDFLGRFAGRMLPDASPSMRYFGFASEPSYAAFIVATCFLGIIRVSNPDERRSVGGWLMVTVFLLLSFRSIYGYLLLAICSVYFAFRVLPKGVVYWSAVLAGGAVGIAVVAGMTVSIGGRLGEFINALSADQMSSLVDVNLVDSSLFMRVAPIVTYFADFNLSGGSLLIGHGAATSTQFFTQEFIGHLNPEGVAEILRPGFLPAFLYDYGLLGATIVMGALWKRVNGGRFSVNGIVLIALLPNANMNTQLFWFVVTVFILASSSATVRPEEKSLRHMTISKGEMQCA